MTCNKESYYNTIFNADSLNILKSIQTPIIDLTFTSPPYYNAKDYSKYDSYNQYLSSLKDIISNIYRITKEGRFFIINTSPVIEPRISRNHQSKRYPIPFDLNTIIQDIGFDFIDDIIWKKPAPSVKNRNGGFYQHRKPLAYKPNIITEYIMVYRKHTDKLIDWNIKQYNDNIIQNSKVNNNYNNTNVWDITPSKHKIHPATFPQILSDDIIKLYSYIGDIILDPFAGIGTVGISCKKYNRKYLLIEKHYAYYKEMIKNLK